MPVSNQKTERLINLTMALLATKRFLSKSEIFSKVAGYAGSVEAMERQFERDKDDLRELGIPIVVGTYDPFFNDEPGYTIPENEYALNLGELTPAELSYISLAAQLWRNQLFSDSGSGVLRKIDSLGGALFTSEIGGSLLSLENESPLFPALWEAIQQRCIISFAYRSKASAVRTIAPFGLTLWHGSWYLVGRDQDKNEIRVFRLSRISSELNMVGKQGAYEIPEEFSIAEHLIMLEPEINQEFTARLRVGTCQGLRQISEIKEVDAEWDLATFKLGNDWRERIFWCGADVVLLTPREKVDEFRALLSEKL